MGKKSRLKKERKEEGYSAIKTVRKIDAPMAVIQKENGNFQYYNVAKRIIKQKGYKSSEGFDVMVRTVEGLSQALKETKEAEDGRTESTNCAADNGDSNNK